MPYANLARIDMDQLYLPFLQKLLEVVAACNTRGAEYRATEGYRSFQEQARLYFQGRTMAGRIVTDALPGYSAHNYGLAVDLCRFVGNRPSWALVDYAILGQEATKAGLLWGGEFHHPIDRPHVQLAGYATAQELEPLKRVYDAHPEAPLSSVWEYLDGRAGGHA